MNSKIRELKKLLNESKFLKEVEAQYKPRDRQELKEILISKAKKRIKDLNDIDVSFLDELVIFSTFDFYKKNNFYVDEWNVSNVKDFSNLFYNCVNFNSPLNWDTSNAVKMSYMFGRCFSFNKSLKTFDVSNVVEMDHFLEFSEKFNQDLYHFRFNRKLKSLNDFFLKCLKFNGDIENWDVSNVENFDYMFYYCVSFKRDLSNWDVSNAKNWKDVFMVSLMEKYPELMPEKFRGDYL